MYTFFWRTLYIIIIIIKLFYFPFKAGNKYIIIIIIIINRFYFPFKAGNKYIIIIIIIIINLFYFPFKAGNKTDTWKGPAWHSASGWYKLAVPPAT